MSRRVLVSGATRGLGRQLALALKRRGFHVTGIGRSDVAPDWLDSYVRADLSDGRFETGPFGGTAFDVLVNNAAVFPDDPRRGAGGITALAEETLRMAFAVNFFAAFRLIQLVLPGMEARNHGRIVNVSSGMARIADFDTQAFAYRSSKLALNALTISTSKAIAAGADLSCFAFCPGWIRTDMGTADAPADADSAAENLFARIVAPATATNGRFFRDRSELDWCAKGLRT